MNTATSGATAQTAPRRTFRQRAVVRLLAGGVWLVRHLPAGLVFRAAFAAGVLLWLIDKERRTLVHANLRQVCVGLVARGLASDRVRAAARDERALGAMTRAAFGHWAVAYAESAVTPGYSAQRLRDRITIPRTADQVAALTPPPSGTSGRVFVSPHFGCIELAGLYAVKVAGLRVWAPMETVTDPALQAYFERTRGATGIGLLPAEGASAVLRTALARGDEAALVADRPIGGGGVLVELFGAKAKLPVGPAALAVESGASVFVVGIRRIGWGRWASHVERLEAPPDGTLRARIGALLEAQARAFERIVAEAPEQWWTVLFPIWDGVDGRAT
ncbi:MAG: lysophospholipid acyltransferase family protein [Candidatus Limnocylindrales bacterium]